MESLFKQILNNMKKEEVMAAIFAVMLKTDKTISELGDADKRTAFEAEVETMAEEILKKEQNIAQLGLDLATANAKVKAAEGQQQTALDLAGTKASEAQNTIASLTAELEKFGKTAEERTAHEEEHARLQGWYEAEKGDKGQAGNDVKGAKLDADKGESGKKTGKEAKLEKLAGFPALKAIVGR
jgi:multidrug resistance efflux pump